MVNELSSHVNVKYEAWANREQVIGEHLRSLYEAQSALSEFVAIERLEGRTLPYNAALGELYKKASKLFQQAYPKILKMKGLNDQDNTKAKETKKKDKFALDYDKMLKAVTKASDYVFGGIGEALTSIEYRDTIILISLLYDKLGYSAAERKVTKTGFLSDIQIPQDDAEGEEMESMD